MMSAVDFLRPAMLVLLLGLGPLWWWQRRWLAGLGPGRRRVSLWLRAGVFALVVLALTEPRLVSQRRATHVFWLVDRSRSVGEEALAKMRGFVAGMTSRPASQEFIAFAGRPESAGDVEALAAVLPKSLDENATDLAGALAFAEATFPAGSARTVVVFSDGQETTGDAAGAIGRLRTAGVRVVTVPVAPPDRPEMLVRGVSAPREVADDEPFKVSAEIVSNREAEAEVSLYRNGARVAVQPTHLRPGVNRFESTQTVAGERVFEFAVEVRPKDPALDTLADNNTAAAYVQAAGRSKVLLLADKPEAARYLALALRQEGIVLDIRPPAGAPTDLGDLQNYDLVVLDNVPATDLAPAQQRLLASYAREFGGGLLMMGGDQAFGLGGYYGTAVEEVLPVRCDFEKQQEAPALGLLLVIDRSGSMSGEKMEMAKDAAKAAVELLGPRDYAGVVAFDHEAFWVAEMGSAADKAGIISRIAGVEAGGGTNIAAGLELGFAQIAGSPAKIRHVILLTDGVSTPGPFYELTTRMAQERITVSTVAVGADADRKLCEQIAEWGGGRSYFTDNPGNIPQIFARETMTASKSAIQEAPFLPVVARTADFLNGVNFDTAPFLLGYVTTRPKPTAEVWLVTERGEPLLATWRYGLGNVGAWTSDARNRWAVEWLRWEGFGRFWAQTVRRLARTPALAKFPVELTRERGGYRVRLDATDGRGEFLSGVTGEVSLVDPRGRPTRVSLAETAPGRLEAWWPAPEAGAYHAQVVLKKDGEALERQFLSAAVPYPEEFSLRGVNEELLRKLAEGTGGRYDPTPAEALANDDRRAPVERELWPWLLGMALAGFLADVAARRWPEREGAAARGITPPGELRRASAPARPAPARG